MIPIRPEKPIETPFLSLSTTGVLHIKAGYAWDGPSGPTIDRPRKHVMRGALIHDALYQLMRWKKLDSTCRSAVDDMMRDYFLEDGMWGWRAKLWHRSVRALAGDAAAPESRKRIHYL